MNRAKAAGARRPSAAAKPSGHPPPGDFIALGAKGAGGETKAALLKPAAGGGLPLPLPLPPERKREPPAAALPGLAKRPKLPPAPPLSALGRLAEAAVAEKRAISPSIKEPSVIPIEGAGPAAGRRRGGGAAAGVPPGGCGEGAGGSARVPLAAS